MNITGQLIQGVLFLLAGGGIIVGSVVLLIKHGRALEKVDNSTEKDKEYEKMENIHAHNSSMSASERLEWLREHKKD